MVTGQSPDKATRLNVIVVTALVTFLITLAGTWTLFVLVGRSAPPIPHLPRPTKITIIVHPLPEWGIKGSAPTEIPETEFAHVIRLVNPVGYLRGGINEFIYPIVAEVVIRHEGEKDSHILVRSCGKNPAIVTVDGENYFWATADDEYSDGSMALVGLVRHLNEGKKP